MTSVQKIFRNCSERVSPSNGNAGELEVLEKNVKCLKPTTHERPVHKRLREFEEFVTKVANPSPTYVT